MYDGKSLSRFALGRRLRRGGVAVLASLPGPRRPAPVLLGRRQAELQDRRPRPAPGREHRERRRQGRHRRTTSSCAASACWATSSCRTTSRSSSTPTRPTSARGTRTAPRTTPTSSSRTSSSPTRSARRSSSTAACCCTAQTYNHMQSAATLMAVDYGPYTFNEIDAHHLAHRPRLRRRGARLPGDDHLEYRAGVFQGLRGVNNTNAFRYAGRLAYYVLGAADRLSSTAAPRSARSRRCRSAAASTPEGLQVLRRRPLLGPADRRRRRLHAAGRLPAARRRRLHPDPPQADEHSMAELGYYFHAAQAPALRPVRPAELRRGDAAGREAHAGRPRLLLQRPQFEPQARPHRRSTRTAPRSATSIQLQYQVFQF